MERSTDEDDGGHQPSSVPLNISSDEEPGSAAVVVPPPKKKQQQAITSMFHATSSSSSASQSSKAAASSVFNAFASFGVKEALKITAQKNNAFSTLLRRRSSVAVVASFGVILNIR